MSKDFLPITPEPRSEAELNLLSPAILSFVGDGVQTLYVRVGVALQCGGKPSLLHKMTADIVNATSQAAATKKILDYLTEEELATYKRCRNFKCATSAKNASVTDYKIATGLEGLIGYLYLSGQHGRLAELLKKAYEND